MSFEVKNRLMCLVNNDATAYKIAIKFIGDDEHSANKLTVFQSCYGVQGGQTDEARAANAADVASERWAVMYPEVVVK